MLGIRLEFTVDEFFASGGIVSFTDRMAGVLGVHRADLKVVAVYEGSTIIEFQVVQLDAEKVEPEELLDLAKVERKFRNLIDTEEKFMGSNILDAKIEGVPLMSPFEKARQREGLFEEDEFKQFVEDQMDGQTKKDTETTNIFGDQTSETDVIEQPKERETIYKKVTIEKREVSNPIGESKAYLLIVGVILIATAMIMAIFCLIRKCSNKSVNIAESVQRAERQKEKDFDTIETA